MQKVAQFYQDMKDNVACALAIFKGVDPVSHIQYKRVYNKTVRRIAGLRNMIIPISVWCSMVAITNLHIDPHCS